MLTSFQKYGRPNENTPAKWNAEYKDYNAPEDPSVDDGPGAPLAPGSAGIAETTNKSDVLSAPPVAPTGEVVEADAGVSANAQTNGGEKSDKKKRKHENETPEERAARKARKAEKKAAKAAKRKSKGGSDSESD